MQCSLEPNYPLIAAVVNAARRWAANYAIRAPRLVQVSEVDSLWNHGNVTSQNYSRRATMATELNSAPGEAVSKEQKITPVKVSLWSRAWPSSIVNF